MGSEAKKAEQLDLTDAIAKARARGLNKAADLMERSMAKAKARVKAGGSAETSSVVSPEDVQEAIAAARASGLDEVADLMEK